MIARILGWQDEIEYQPGKRHHHQVFGIVPSDTVGTELGSCRKDAGDAKAAEVAAKPPAFVGQQGIVKPVRKRFQSSTYQPVAWGVEGEFLKAAGDSGPCRQVVFIGSQDIDAATNPVQHCRLLPVATAKIAPQALLDRIAKQSRDQARKIGRTFGLRIVPPVKLCQVGGEQEQQPDIADRNLADQARLRLRRLLNRWSQH